MNPETLGITFLYDHKKGQNAHILTQKYQKNSVLIFTPYFEPFAWTTAT